MWVFLSNAMLSIVEHRDDPKLLLVRARLRGDIERILTKAEVSETPTADYRFRANATRAEVAAAVAKHLLAIDYPNFKNSVADRSRHDAYMGVWSEMSSAQNRQLREEASTLPAAARALRTRAPRPRSKVRRQK